MRSPIKWVGGKSRLRKTIIELLPSEHTCYVEPFCGAAWVLFGKKPSSIEIINDIDGDLINFFRVIKHQPEQCIKSFEFELVSRAEFNRLANIDTRDLTDIERAHRFFYLIMAGWGGELNYPRFQTSVSDAGHGNRLIGALKTLNQRIQPVHARLSTVIIEHLDWRECIKKYDRKGVVMYLDPPYPGNGVNYAHNMRNWQDHQDLANLLKSSEAQWILSSYDNPEVREMFRGYSMKAVKSTSGMRKTKQSHERVVVEEILIMNYQPKNNVSAPSSQIALI